MATTVYAHFDAEPHGGVTVARITSEENRHPYEATELSQELADLVARDGVRDLLIDFSRNHYLGSSAFAVLLGLAQKLEAAGGRLKVCGLDPNVRIGANIIGLGRLVEIFEDQRSALKSF
jgi:anti-anti-sigma factor